KSGPSRSNLYKQLILVVLLFFFFQPDDGIRDFHVTGVQTCALPISSRRATSIPELCARRDGQNGPRPHRRIGQPGRDRRGRGARSEERRVGQECRAGRWWYAQST